MIDSLSLSTSLRALSWSSGVAHSYSSLAAFLSAGSVAAGLLSVTRHASTYARHLRPLFRHDSHVGLGSVPTK